MFDYERWEEPQLAIESALDRVQSRIWTKLPCVVVSVEADGQHVTVRPTIMALQRNVAADGTVTWTSVQLPDLPMVLIKFPSGGGYTMTFPVTEGDEGTVSFASRCIDNWWQLGGVQPQLAPNGVGSRRKHDLSDGFFELGGRSVPNLLTNVSNNSVQLRSDDGTAVVNFNKTELTATLPSGAATLTLNSSGFSVVFPGGSFSVDNNGNTITTGNATIEENIQVNGNMKIDGTTDGTGTITSTSDVIAGSISLKSHEQSGVQPGTGKSGPPL